MRQGTSLAQKVKAEDTCTLRIACLSMSCPAPKANMCAARALPDGLAAHKGCRGGGSGKPRSCACTHCTDAPHILCMRRAMEFMVAILRGLLDHPQDTLSKVGSVLGPCEAPAGPSACSLALAPQYRTQANHLTGYKKRGRGRGWGGCGGGRQVMGSHKHRPPGPNKPCPVPHAGGGRYVRGDAHALPRLHGLLRVHGGWLGGRGVRVDVEVGLPGPMPAGRR